MLETMLYPARTRAANLPSAEILNFCVSTAAQGLGVGQRLFTASVEEFRRRCVREIRIVTGVRQQSARRFYDSAGARCVGKVAVHRGSPELVYTFSIS